MLTKIRQIPLKVTLSVLHVALLVALALWLEPTLVLAAAATVALIYSVTTLLVYWND